MLNLEKKLYENWNSRITTALKAAEKARRYILKKGCASLVSAINNVEETDKIDTRDLSKAELCTTKGLLREFEQKWGIKSPTVGISLSPDAWKRIKEKLHIERWVVAYFWSKDHLKYYKNKSLPLNKTGLILIKQDKKIVSNVLEYEVLEYEVLEHEAIHAAYSLYSKSSAEVNKEYDRLKKRKSKKGFYPFLRLDMEMDFVDELAAYRAAIDEEEGYDWRWAQGELSGDYIKNHLKEVKEETGINLKKQAVYLKKRLPKVVTAVRYLQKKLGDKALTRILFTVGPTAKEIKEKQYSSPFDDLLKWKDLVKRKKIDKNYFETHFNLPK